MTAVNQHPNPTLTVGDSGGVSLDAKEDRLADFCIASVQGAMLMGKIQRNSEAAEGSLREALSHLRRYSAPK